MLSAKYANNHNKLRSTGASLKIGVFDAFQCTKRPTGDWANRSRKHAGFVWNCSPRSRPCFILWGSNIWVEYCVAQSSLMSNLYDPLHYAKQKVYTMRQNLILPTSSSRLNASQNRNKTQYVSYRVNKTGRVDHETTNCGIVVSKSVNDTNLKHACYLSFFLQE